MCEKKLTKARNRGELAEGWYDPATKLKADEFFATTLTHDRSSPDYKGAAPEANNTHDEEEEDRNGDSDGYGPHPPSASSTHANRVRSAGPSAPTFQDLAVRADMSAEDAEAQREAGRAARKADRRVQKERLEELVPRAEAGTRERQMEKKREKGAQAKEFRDGGGAGGEVEEVGEGELMGGGEEGVKGLRRREERKRNEREVRKEEILRARQGEREERLKGLREKEEKGMGLLRRIAKERFG